MGTIYAPDQVQVAQTGQGLMQDKYAGQDKIVEITGLSLNGADADNYELVNTTARTDVDIAKKSIGYLEGFTAPDRPYNGSNQVAVDASQVNMSGFVTGDDVFVGSLDALANQAQAGQNIAVHIQNIQLSGNDAANYVLQDTTSATTVNILAPQLGNPYQRAIDFEEDEETPLDGRFVQIEVIGDGVNMDGIQTVSQGGK